MLQYVLFLVLGVVAPRVPPRVAYWLCDRLGDLAHLLLPGRRRVVERNLAVVLGGQAEGSSARAREVFRQGARYYYDTFRIPALSFLQLESMISVEGWEQVERARVGGKGAIILTAHLGSPALVAQIMAARGFNVTTVAEPIRPRKLFDLVNSARGSRGIRMLPLGPGSMRELSEVLRRNDLVGILVDRDVPKTGIAVEFFGVETTMPAGPVMLALRTGAPLIPAFTCRLPDGCFAARVEMPIELERTGDLRRDVRAGVRKMVGVLENAIARSPEQWVVFDPVWPEGGGLRREACR